MWVWYLVFDGCVCVGGRGVVGWVGRNAVWVLVYVSVGIGVDLYERGLWHRYLSSWWTHPLVLEWVRVWVLRVMGVGGVCVYGSFTCVVDEPVAVGISLSDHLADLLVTQILPEVRHDLLQLWGRDHSVPILIKHLKQNNKLCSLFILSMAFRELRIWTYSDISSEHQNQSCLIPITDAYMVRVPRDSHLVPHLSIYWKPAVLTMVQHSNLPWVSG